MLESENFNGDALVTLVSLHNKYNKKTAKNFAVFRKDKRSIQHLHKHLIDFIKFDPVDL